MLQQLTLPPPKKGSLPLFLEFSINPELSPFLVSSTRGLIWVYKTKESRVRSAIRKDLDEPSLYKSVIDSIVEQGDLYSWGNVFYGGLKAIENAKERMSSYGFTEIDILSGDKDLVDSQHGLTFRSCIPKDTLVLVPRDREYLGFLGTFPKDSGNFCLLVHNASRGICIILK